MLNQLSKSSNYLDDEDWVSIKVALNLSPTLINWNKVNIKRIFLSITLINLKI